MTPAGAPHPRPNETASAPMLRLASVLFDCTIGASDGDIGRVHDLLFDDRSWTVRYLVGDTSGWLAGRRVLISPVSIEGLDVGGRRLLTQLTKAEVEGSPGIDTARPVSRQREAEVMRYYRFPYYWSGPYRWGPAPYPAPLRQERGRADAQPPRPEDSQDDPHLRSAREVRGYGIRATDGDLGHVVDFLVDEECWAIRYLVVDPRSWWPGKHVLMSVEWITGVSWNDSVVAVTMTREAVRDAPEWNPTGELSRDYETRLHEHYGRPGYWDRRAEAYLIAPGA